MEDPSKLASFYHQKMTQAYEDSQQAWKDGRKGDAKKFSEDMKTYKEKMKEFNEMAKQKKVDEKIENQEKLSEKMENLISKEYKKIDENFNNFEVLQELNTYYVNCMKQNFDDSQNSFRKGSGADAKKFAELGKVYKSLVQISNDKLKEAKRLNSVKTKYLSEQQLREVMSDKKVTIKFSEVEDVETGNERNYAAYYATEMKKQYELAQDAWNKNDKQAAKKHSDIGNNYKEYMHYYNKVAAKNAFVKNNINKDTMSEVDLHGLTATEATCILDEKIKKCINDDIKDLKIICWKGLHSCEK